MCPLYHVLELAFFFLVVMRSIKMRFVIETAQAPLNQRSSIFSQPHPEFSQYIGEAPEMM